jgi:hypothetical protein
MLLALRDLILSREQEKWDINSQINFSTLGDQEVIDREETKWVDRLIKVGNIKVFSMNGWGFSRNSGAASFHSFCGPF